MSDTKHTPGPWSVGEIEEFEDAAPIVNVDAPGEHHTGFVQVNGRVPSGEFTGNTSRVDFMYDRVKADAALIAAAPKMFALLKELIAIEGPQPGHAEWYRRVVETVAEAEADV